MASWAALRGDKNQINEGNINSLDWVTHVRNKVGLDDLHLYRQFSENAMNHDDEPKPDEPVATAKEDIPAGALARIDLTTGDMTKVPKLNFGAGNNRLPGWENHDRDVDITRKLPFKDNYASVIFAEHVVEHVPYYRAIEFFKECRRVLAPSGVIRITVPSLAQIMAEGNDEEYIAFVHGKGWAPTSDLRGVMHAILYKHGHQAAWVDSLLHASLYYVGFTGIKSYKPGESERDELRGIEGHHKIIGEKFNNIESISVEAVVDK
jgi:SAM-dependent methyltransferase